MPDYEDWWPLRTIAEKLGITSRQLNQWELKRDKNGFPEPKETLGRFKLFDIAEVQRWHVLYSRATDGMNNGDRLNGRRPQDD